MLLANQKSIFVFLLGWVMVIACHPSGKNNKSAVEPYGYDIQKKVLAKKGAVVSAHPLASQVGLQVLKSGGNAIDAAIATQLALAVVYPSAGNLGGGGFMVARLADGNEIAIDYRETAPGGASRDMFIDSTGTARTDLSQDGHLSSGVPGTVAGLIAASKHGKLPFDQLILPAIKLAEEGFVITDREANSLNSLQEEFRKNNTIVPVFVRHPSWKRRDTLIQADLARTLKRIKENGQDGFYKGETARLIVEEMERGGGIITYEDLSGYQAKFRQPHSFTYKGYRILGMPLPSSGGILLNQMMRMIENRGLAEMGFHSVSAVQLMIEVERRAYADRAEYLGDIDFFDVPVRMLTDPEYLQARMRSFNPRRATPSSLVKPGISQQTESPETTHLSVMDAEGNAVAVTTTLNNSYGSRTVVGGAGFLLNDEMDDFSIKPGTPNLYGAVGGEANAIMPGKRMLSSMTPTVVLKNQEPILVLGTPGGTTIPTSVFQTLMNIMEFGMSTEDAVYLPKFHHQWLPDSVFVESAFPLGLRDSLTHLGYHLLERSPIGRTELIKRRPDGNIEAVADNRGDDDARGW